MWFKFPEKIDSISVERQNFVPEFTGEDGSRYFRAPAHFEPKLRGLAMGFVAVPSPPEGAPEDFPDITPATDHTLQEAIARAAGFETEVQNLRTENSSLNAKLGAAMHELEDTKLKLHETATKLVNFKDDLEEAGVEIPKKVLADLES